MFQYQTEIKNCSVPIPVQTPVRTTLIECVFDYCRIAFDVLPQEAQLSVAIEDCSSSALTLQLLNEWHWKEQSFLHVRACCNSSLSIAIDIYVLCFVRSIIRDSSFRVIDPHPQILNLITCTHIQLTEQMANKSRSLSPCDPYAPRHHHSIMTGALSHLFSNVVKKQGDQQGQYRLMYMYGMIYSNEIEQCEYVDCILHLHFMSVSQ